jgi:hypothetical protein
MRSHVCTRLVFLFLATLVWHPAAFTQIGTTSVRGTVTDKTGAVIGGATVRLSSPGLALERTATTSPTGQYEFVACRRVLTT